MSVFNTLISLLDKKPFFYSFKTKGFTFLTYLTIKKRLSFLMPSKKKVYFNIFIFAFNFLYNPSLFLLNNKKYEVSVRGVAMNSNDHHNGGSSSRK